MLLWNWPRTCWICCMGRRSIPRANKACNGAQRHGIQSHMSGVRLILPCLLCVTALAVSAQTKDQSAQPQPEFRTGVTEIVVPVTVHDRDGNIVNGLQPREFHLTDNGKEQNITVDVSYHPISLALVIQANGAVDAILPQV